MSPKIFEINIWAWRPSRRSMTHGNKFPTPRRPNMVPPSMQNDLSHSTISSAWWLKTERRHPWSFLIGEHMSIWMSPFCFESSCARDGGMWWIILHRRRGPYLVVGVRGILLTMSHTATRGSSWPYMDFKYILVTSVPGEGGVMPLYSIWAGSTLLWVPPPPRVFGVTKNDHSLLLITVRYLKLKCDLYYINLNVIDKRHSINIQIYLETLSICTDELLRHNWSRKSMAR